MKIMNSLPVMTTLLVEDNRDHAELVIRNFEEQQQVESRVICVWDGAEAIEYLFRNGKYADPELSPRPHLVLLDLRLPKIDGLEVLKRIKTSEELRCIPVVVLSSSKMEADITGAYSRHVNSYLVKPVEFSQFAQLMDDLRFYWLTWNRAPVGNAISMADSASRSNRIWNHAPVGNAIPHDRDF